MRTLLRTPTGVLGLISIILLVVLTVISTIFFVSIGQSANQTVCIGRELAKPWASLRTTFKNPAGDAEARAVAAKIIDRALARMDHIDKYC